MAEPINILVVEDELLIAMDLQEIIEASGIMRAIKARNYQQAIDALNTQPIRLALVDINLNGNKTGVDVALHINQNNKIPFLYTTSYSDNATIESVKHTHPSGFLLKPVTKSQILASIEIALFSKTENEGTKLNVAAPEPEDSMETITANYFLVKDKFIFIKVHFDEVLFIETNKNYIMIKTLAKKYTVRLPLKKVLEMLPQENFIRCSKQFVVNIKYVESFSSSKVDIKGSEIAISRSQRTEVLKRLKV